MKQKDREKEHNERRTKTRDNGSPKCRILRGRVLVVVGAEPRLSEVSRTLDELELEIHREGVKEDGSFSLPANTCGVAVISPRTDVGLAHLIEWVDREDESGEIPIFAIVADGTTSPIVRSLYSTGVSAVFEWPSEAPRLAELVAERLGIAFARGIITEEDNALARTISAHLRSSSTVRSGVKVSAHRGVAEVRGEVESLWRKRELEALVADIPGVSRVVARDLRVQASGRADEDIEASIRSVLAATSEVAEETIAVTSNNGFVVLAGSVEDRRELGRILEIVTHVRGVRDIEVLMTIAPEAKSTERSIARRLQSGVNRLQHDGKVKVTVFGNTAVLTGTVRTAITRGLIEQRVNRDNALQRVVNKLEVADRG